MKNLRFITLFEANVLVQCSMSLSNSVEQAEVTMHRKFSIDATLSNILPCCDVLCVLRSIILVIIRL